MSTQRSVINSKQWYSYSDAALYLWGTNFATVVSENETVLGIDEGELEVIQGGITRFQTAYDALVAAKAAYEAAVQTKEFERSRMINDIRPFVGQFQSMPGIPKAVYADMDIPAKAKPGPRTAPEIPSDFVATPYATGAVVFSWNRNGNSASTLFSIQESTPSGWITIWSGTRKKVTLSGYAPGVETLFRLIATRNNETSLPTNTVSIYQTGEEGSVQLAA